MYIYALLKSEIKDFCTGIQEQQFNFAVFSTDTVGPIV